ncbi:hypothetical protein GcM1_227043 [Golovinomyces cichoracearum]|uniref:Uncharacterized protein n=1 Tax=Golovinomyces cichoracearum TaxID=62708 RepID=A0A420IPC0_9PEZI|nr:hypothetical protein GcM1_227043 [Golovinomyces cichoracearum]
MAERKDIFWDVAGAKRPSLSVLPIINVTPFSGRDQDAGRWIAVSENKVKARRPSEISDLERDVFTDQFVRQIELVVAPESEPQQQKTHRGVASSVNKFVIEMIEDRFVLGNYDEELNKRVVDRGVASSKSLHQALEDIQGCQITMSDQARQNEMWQQMQKAKAFDLIQENPAEVNAVVNDFAQFNIDSVRAGNFRRPYAVAGVTSALPGRIIPTEADSTQESYQRLSLPVPSSFQRHKNEQQYSNNSSGYQGPPQRDSWRSRGENYSKYQNHVRNIEEFEGQRQVPSSHQNRSVDSTHPLVNGSMPFKRACWDCGNGPTGTGPFHYTPECPGPMLMQWEQDILQSKSRENISKPTASQVISNRVSSSWQAYGENTLHQTGEPSDSSEQSEASRVNASGNAVDCFTVEYLLDEPATVYPAGGIEKGDTWFKEDDPVASEVLLTAHVNEILARKRPQASTTAQTEFKKLIIGEIEKRKKGNPEVAHVSLRKRQDKGVNFRKQNLKERVNKVLETSSQAHDKIESCESIQPHQYKSFRIPVQIEAIKNGEKHRVELKIGFTHADQGVDFCLILSSLAKALAKALGIVHKILLVPMRFGTADGGTTMAKHFASIQIGVAEIWRRVDVLILPQVKNETNSLLLGLPWLYQNLKGKKESILDPFQESSDSDTSTTESGESESECSEEDEKDILQETKSQGTIPGKDTVTDKTSPQCANSESLLKKDTSSARRKPLSHSNSDSTSNIQDISITSKRATGMAEKANDLFERVMKGVVFKPDWRMRSEPPRKDDWRRLRQKEKHDLRVWQRWNYSSRSLVMIYDHIHAKE